MSFFTSFLERLQNQAYFWMKEKHSGGEKKKAMCWMIRILNGKKDETITEKNKSKHDTFLKKS